MNLVGQGNDERSQWRWKDLAGDLENKKMIPPHKVASIIDLNCLLLRFFVFTNSTISILQV
jgi:hypothetical protein